MKYLYYVVATENTKDRKGNVKEVQDTHAIIADNLEHFYSRCDELFSSYDRDSVYSIPLNKDW